MSGALTQPNILKSEFEFYFLFFIIICVRIFNASLAVNLKKTVKLCFFGLFGE